MKRQGYILVETLVAMTVLAISILGVHRAISQALTARARTMDFTIARFLLEEKLSGLLLQPLVLEGEGEGTFPAPHERFKFRWNIKKIMLPALPLPPDLPPDKKNLEKALVKYMGKIAVTVSWERSGQTFERSGETLIGGGNYIVPGRTLLWQPPPQEGNG